MKTNNFTVIILASFLIFLILQFPHQCYAVKANSPADPTRVLAFLGDVVGLNMTKYDVKLMSCSAQNFSDISIFGDVGYIWTYGKYGLVYEDKINFNHSYLGCTFNFADATLMSCDLYADTGKPLFSKPLPLDLTSAAATFLERYQAFTGDKELNEMRSMLTGFDATKDSMKIVGDLKLAVKVTSYSTLISWNPTFNNADYPGINLEFKDGVFSSFVDNRCRFTVGKTDVNISEQQAIDIALKRAGTYSYTYGDKVIGNFSIVKDQIRTELRPLGNRTTIKELYPSWTVYLPLSQTYPGAVSVIRVTIWADNGEIVSCDSLSYGGSAPPDSAGNSEDLNSAGNQTDFSLAYVAAAIIAILVSAMAIAVLIKKRKKK